ncbi:MAG: hypothetical protein E4H07_05805 [Nitrosomonadales bacterium]|nr:MAG: hypothetical protein E4H07_05805 [Nitrosomonadales bacterium]
MKFPLISLAFILVFFFISSSTIATETAGSYLGISGYPSHTCPPPPSKPVDPGSLSERVEIEKYNIKVDNYNSQMRIYMDCMRDYIDAAKNDIKKIRVKITDTINEVNSQ